MYKTITFLLTISLLAFSTIATAIPAKPGKIEYKLPDGTSIEITLKGDEKISWAETEDGYSLLLNKEGFYEYATLNENGDMVRSGIRAYNSNERTQEQMSFVSKLNKKVHFSRSQVNLMHQIWDINEKEGTKAFPTTGNRKLICILMGFQDQAFTKNQADFNDLFNQVGYSIDGATGSVKDYYLENSYNQFDLTVDVTGPYTASENMYYYGGEGGTDNPRPLVSEAIDFADPDVDFSDYDNDGDGAVDGVYIIYAGYGKEAGGPVGSIWAHAWQLASPVYKDGVSLQRYSCSAELRGNSGSNLTRIGVICHEFGHVLGAPDYYDTDYETGGQYQGTGQWDMMAGGSWNNGGATPAHHNGFTKVVYYNWAAVTELTSPTTIVLNNAAENSNSFYKISTATPNEYFLIENREKHLFDAAIPGSGMMIYHVHSGVFSVGNQINATHPQRMYPVAQNATGEPTNTSASYGSINIATCAWTGTGKTEFSDASLPSSKSWAAANTNKPITNIVRNATDKTVTFDFMGGGNNPSDFVASAVSTTQINLSWDASAFNGAVVAFSTDGTFGTPVDGSTYSVGNSIPGGGTVLYNGTGSSYNHSGLQSSTAYFYKIWAMEDGTPTYTSGVATSESTLCDVITTLPYTNDFAGQTLPPCWDNIDNDGSGQIWEFNNPGGRTFSSTTNGNGFAILDSDEYGNGSSQNADMVSPTFNLTNYNSVTLTFEHYFRSYSGSSATLSYSLDGGSNWTDLDSWTADEGGGTTPIVFSQDLSTEVAGESNVKFKWNYTGSWGYYWCVDDIEIDGVMAATETVTFTVTDADDSHPIVGASISINSQLLSTNSSGQATIEMADGIYAYTVNMAGYYEATGSVTVSGAPVAVDVAITAIPPVTFNVNVTNVTCNGGSDGEIEFTNAAGGSGSGYEYSINGGVSWQSSTTFSDLIASSYAAKVKDGDGMISDTDPTDVTEPDAIAFSVNVTNVSTYGGSDGSIEVTNVTGGTGSYEYSIDEGSNWQVGNTFSGLIADTYMIQVKDANLCTSDVSEQTITQPAPPVYIITFNVTDADDAHAIDGAEINVNSTTLTTDATGVATIDLEDGTYSYTVTKTNYEIASGSVIVTGSATTVDVQMTPIVPLTFSVATTNATCNGANDGVVEITNAAGGSGSGYQYSIDNGATWQASSVFNGLVADTYSVVIKDSEANVSDMQSAAISEPTAVVLGTTDVTAVSTYGGSDGTITFTNATGGTSPYEYSIDNGTTWQTTNSFTGLIAGTYTAVVSDANNCLSDTEGVTITQPAENMYTVTFTVYEGDHVVAGATIDINSETIVTDTDGICSIDLVNGTYSYTANFSGYTEITGEVIVNDADVNETISFVGINGAFANQINIYPNPVSSTLTIDLDGNFTVTLVNGIGKVIVKKSMETKGMLEVDQYADGLYLLRIEQNGQIITKPVIIKK